MKKAGTPKDAGLSVSPCWSVLVRDYQLMRDTNWMTRLVFVPVSVVTR
jgi:hypothetical protein